MTDFSNCPQCKSAQTSALPRARLTVDLEPTATAADAEKLKQYLVTELSGIGISISPDRIKIERTNTPVQSPPTPKFP